jgi:putative tryptophan/tyrosine transport system substrate-binding protein
MNRREFITLIGGAAAWPLATRAQEQGRAYRLGAVIPVGREHPAIVAFFDELRLFGFIENENLTVIPGGFNIGNDQLAERAAALVKAAPDAIISGPDNYTRVLQQATRTIPLIAMTEDMVAAGLVASLARPGGNTTGISLLSPELDGKRQDILIEAVPGLRKMAALADSTITPERHLQALQDGMRRRGVELLVFGVARREDVLSAIETAKKRARKRSICWRRRCSPSTAAPSSSASRRCVCQPCTNGPNWRKTVASWATVRASPRRFVRGRGWSPACCAALSPPTFRSSNRRTSNW